MDHDMPPPGLVQTYKSRVFQLVLRLIRERGIQRWTPFQADEYAPGEWFVHLTDAAGGPIEDLSHWVRVNVVARELIEVRNLD
jgi:hypothetical protein